MEDRSNNRGGRRPRPIFAVVLTVTAFAVDPANAAGNTAHGETLYKDCQNCHSIEKNDVGPMHKGVVGRAAGTVPGYDYSAALRA